VNDVAIALGKRLARLSARAVAARPGLWRLFRGPLRAQFDALAPHWEDMGGPNTLVPLAAALDRLGAEPARVLDLGTGTGKAARLLAERYPAAEVVGVDLAPAMIEEARKLVPPELAPRLRFEVADASALPFEDGAFDLVGLVNMIPFFGELWRVTAPGGAVAICHGAGPSTPIWTPPETLRRGLEPLGFGSFEELAAADGTAFLARKQQGE
jgi:SAM-dependent methyltransferase